MKVKDIIKKICTKEVMLYATFGVLTTIVNLLISFVLNKVFLKMGITEKISASASSAIGIIVAVIVAYFTNRKLVFNSKAKSINEKLREFGKFIIGRAFTMIVEEGGVILFNGIIGWKFEIVKITLTITVIILNFFISKFFAFKN